MPRRPARSSRCERSAPLAADLRALLPLEHSGALDWFIGHCLTDSDVWDRGRTSDGINSFGRVFEHGHDRLCLWGRIWELLGQTLHVFWLEVKRDSTGDQFAWFLYFDVAEGSARRQQAALDSHDDAEDIDWRAKIVGEAIVRDTRLVIVPGSTRVLIRDMPEPEPNIAKWDRRERRRK